MESVRRRASCIFYVSTVGQQEVRTDHARATVWRGSKHDDQRSTSTWPPTLAMNAELQWDATRWRDHDRSSQMPAPTPRPTEDAKGLLRQYDQVSWDKPAQHTIAYGGYAPFPAAAHRRPSDASETFMRHTTPGTSATPRSQHEHAFTSPHHPNYRQQGLQGSSIDDGLSKPREVAGQSSDAPPALHIPRNDGMYRSRAHCRYPCVAFGGLLCSSN